MTALVTGASRGLGLALARSLAADGWHLIIDGRDPVALEAAGARLRPLTDVVTIAGDVASEEHRLALAEAAAAAGGLDVAVHNASLLGPSPQPRLADYPIDVLAHVFEVNVLAPLRLVQLSLPSLRQSQGTVVNLTSDAAVESYEEWGGYGSSKAGLEQLSSILAAEEPDITVYWFDPGDMQTRMHQEAFPGEDISDRPPPETRAPALLRLIEGRYPSGRYAAAELLAEMVGT